MGRLDQLIMLDAALNRRSLELKALDGFTVTSARTVAWLRARADSSAESPIETIARLSLATLGVRVLSQVTIPGVGRVDFLVEDSVIVEMDGRAHHSDAAAFSRDRARDRAAAALGLVVLRFTFADATTCPGLIAGDVLAALRARRPRAVPA
ncbi:MAG: GxxExxY protein [Demequinaceae bacterium]|nr:GxxExxY protein [Demequinaceae bacterium]